MNGDSNIAGSVAWERPGTQASVGSLYENGRNSYDGGMTTTGTISEKGQVTIPKPMRDAFGIRPGDRLEFDVVGDAIRIRKSPDLDRLAALYGSVRLPAPVDQLIDEMRGGPADL